MSIRWGLLADRQSSVWTIAPAHTEFSTSIQPPASACRAGTNLICCRFPYMTSAFTPCIVGKPADRCLGFGASSKLLTFSVCTQVNLVDREADKIAKTL